jgi:outer membrane immunogenic protein
MRRILLVATAAVTLSAGSALAADPAMPDLRAPAYTWTGFYAGPSFGIVAARSRQTYGGDRSGVPDAFLPLGQDVTGNYSVTGPIFGAQLGYNYQMNQIVMGVELDASAVFAKGMAGPNAVAVAAGANPLRRFHTDQRWLATARARLGFAADRWLVYVTGGLAVSGLSGNNEAVLVAANADRRPAKVTRVGWVVGAGAEYALGGAWSMKGEILYADFGTFFYSDSPAANGCVQCYSMNVRTSEWIGRVGFNYRFGG